MTGARWLALFLVLLVACVQAGPTGSARADEPLATASPTPSETGATEAAPAPSETPPGVGQDIPTPSPETQAAQPSQEPSLPTAEVHQPASGDGSPAPPQATGEMVPPAAPVQESPPEVVGIALEPRGSRPGGVRTVALDPGHGGPEPGAGSGGLAEKNANLQIALMLAEMLRDDGFRVVLTRDSDTAVSPAYVEPGVRGQLTLDLQARVDIANRANADIFISIHNNGSADSGQRGTEVWYNRFRPFSDRNFALAELVLENIVRQLRVAGHSAVSRGVKEDTFFRIFRGRPYNIYVLGPGDGGRPHAPTAMPGVLGESLFLSNPYDIAALRRAEIQQAIAQGYRDAVVQYFERYPN